MLDKPAGNLSIALIRHHRYRPAFPPRHTHHRSYVHAHHQDTVHLHGDPFPRPIVRAEEPAVCQPCDDPWKPQAWPYDTAMPAGLPRLPVISTDVTDNSRLPLTRPQLPSIDDRPVDQRGKIIDFSA